MITGTEYNLLTNGIIISLVCVAIHVMVNWPGMILSWLEQYLFRLPSWLRKPTYECLICMSSVWTAVLWFPLGGDLSPIIFIQMLIVAGINVVPAILIPTLQNVAELIDHELTKRTRNIDVQRSRTETD